MALIATVLSDPAAPAVDDAALAALSATLPLAGAPAVLAPGIAADLPLAADIAEAAAMEQAARAAIGGRPIDVVVQKAEGRRKRLLIADMDSTMILQECIDELAAMLGLKERIAAITERAMRGEIAFEPALRERVALLAGLDVSVIDTVLAERVRLTPGARTLVRTMRAAGAYCALVSGGFTAFTSPIAAEIGFHEHRANELVVESGKLVGRVAEPILGREAKRDRLSALMAERGLSAAETMAVGDGANDLAMIDLAGLGVAYRAKPVVAAQADARIDHGDLTALLYIQGYRASEFVDG